MLGRRCRLWASIVPKLGRRQRTVLADSDDTVSLLNHHVKAPTPVKFYKKYHTRSPLLIKAYINYVSI